MSIASLRKFSQDLRRLKRDVAHKVAAAVAPEITRLAQASVAQSETPYGVPWAPSAEGGKVTLRRTGRMLSKMVYVAIGAKLRVALGVPYAKFQIGKRPVFPTQGGQLPPSYVQTLQRVAVDVCRKELA